MYHNKRLAIPPNEGPPPVDVSPSSEVTYEVYNMQLHICNPDGVVTGLPVSRRFENVGGSQKILFNNEPDNVDDGIPLYFPRKIEPSLLARYLCAELAPEGSFPALSVSDFFQLACIETYVGCENAVFWRRYLDSEGNADVVTRAAQYVSAADEKHASVAERTPQEKWCATWAPVFKKGLGFEGLSVGALRDIARNQKLDTRLIPFLYGNLGPHLGSLSEERLRILQTHKKENLLEKHLYWLYQAKKETLTPEHISEERQAILQTKIAPNVKIAAMKALYHACEGRITEAMVVAEREAILATNMTGDLTSRVLANLYASAASPITGDRMVSERTAILRSKLADAYRAEVLGGLYKACLGRITGDMMVVERTVILGSDMDPYYKGPILSSLYTAAASEITGDGLVAERIAILESNMGADRDGGDKAVALLKLYVAVAEKGNMGDMLSAETGVVLASDISLSFKFDLLRTLYITDKAHITRERVVAEREAILAANIDSDLRKALLRELYGVSPLTSDLIVAEREAILLSTLPVSDQHAMIRDLYIAGGTWLTSDMIEDERASIMAADMDIHSKHGAVRWLYKRCGALITPQILSAERIAILASEMDVSDKTNALINLYQACKEVLTPDVIRDERMALLAADLPNPHPVILSLYAAGKSHVSSQMIADECLEILASRRNITKYYELAKLYREGEPCLAGRAVGPESFAVLASESLVDEDKYTIVSKLYSAGASQMTGEIVVRERAAILDATMGLKWKVVLLRSLYIAGSTIMTGEMVTTERDELMRRLSDGHYREDVLRYLAKLEGTSQKSEGVVIGGR